MSKTKKPEGKRDLLFSVTHKDLVVQTFSAGGKGGQNQNRRSSGVRIIHPESGARGESREHRSQLENKRAALKRMTETAQFRYWVREKTKEIDGQETIEQKVEKMMAEDNIKVEHKDENGEWYEASGEQAPDDEGAASA